MAASAPLAGIRVVDLTTVVFGPYCTQILADLGADVIKVEAPGVGDAFRWATKGAVSPGMSAPWMAINRGKRAAALDLKAELDRAVLLDLLRTADVFVVNVRGRALGRLGLDPASLRALNPRLIYVHCVGFGQDGPYADLQAYDDVIQAASGTATLLPRADGDPRPRYLPSLLADKVAGLHAAQATLTALFARERTGEAAHVEVPMFEAFTGFMLQEHLGGLAFDPPTAPAGYPRQLDPDRQPFPAADGHVSIVAYTDEAWQRIFTLLDAPGTLDELGLTTRELRARAMPRLLQAIARLTPALPAVEIVRRCHAADIPAQAVRDLGDMLDDPHLAATGFFRRRTHPTEGGVVELTPPIRFDGAVRPPLAPAPLPGEHTAAVRAQGWGESDEHEPAP